MFSKKSILNELYMNISEYAKQYDKSADAFINNLNNCIVSLKITYNPFLQLYLNKIKNT